MNRNRVFMLSYIAFIFVSIIVRAFWDFPMWNSLVAAVTCTSFFFALADLNCSSYNNNIKLLNDYESETIQQREHAMNLLFFIKFMLKNDMSVKNTKLLDECKNETEEIIKDIEQKGSIYEKTLKKNNMNLIQAQIFLFFGFILFFCILSFKPITDYIIKYQEMITMFVFAIVLLSPFWDESTKKRNEKAIERTKKITERIMNLERKYKEGVMANAH